MKKTITNEDVSILNNILKEERKQRALIVAIILPVFIGLILMFSPNILFFYNIDPLIQQFLGTTLFSVSGMIILLKYLQTGFKKSGVQDIIYQEYQNEQKKQNELNLFDLKKIEEKLATLQSIVDQNSSLRSIIADKDSDALVDLIKSQLIEKSTDITAKELLSQIEEKVKKINHLNEIESVFSKTLERLYMEISALTRRGNLNLALGILTTIIGLGILGYFVIAIDKIPEDKVAFIAYFIPRLSLVILIEIFAYFFLKLYKSSLSEIKYFQNEMTNSEAKLIALKCSLMISDVNTISSVITTLSNTERNAILEKGQTTAEIEKAKIEQQSITTISERISNLLKKDKIK